MQTDRGPSDPVRNSWSSLSPTKDPVKSVRMWQKYQIVSAYERLKESERLAFDLQSKEFRRKANDGVGKEDSVQMREKRISANQKWIEKLQLFRLKERKSENEAVKKAEISLEEMCKKVEKVKNQRVEYAKNREESHKSRFEQVKSHLMQQAQIANSEIIAKLKKYQLRMEKSERCHEQQLKSRSQTLSKQR